MNGNTINYGLPIIANNNTNTEPKSLSYFKYAKSAMKVGDFNPNYNYLGMPTGYHPYHQPTSFDPLYKSQDTLLFDNTNLGKHPFLNSYPLPPINKSREVPIKELKSGELVDFPDETFIPLSKFIDYKTKKEFEIKMNKEKEKAKEEERKRIELYGVNGEKKPSGASDIKKFHNKNLRHWKFLRNSTNIICGYLRMKQLALGHKDLHAKRFVLIQSAKEGLSTIRAFLLTILSNIENFCVEFFRNTIIFSTNNKEKLDRSIFVTKAFVHQLFSDLTSAFVKKGDIPIEVKRVINSYITDGSLLPFGFLSTFEFNRLEFNTDGHLINMNLERQGLLVCFIVLYRILLADIFKRYLFYFQKIREMDLEELELLEIFEKKLEQYEKKMKEKYERNKRPIMKRGHIPGVEEDEDDEEIERREKEEDDEEKKIFEDDEKEEERNRKRDNQESLACPPKKKKRKDSDDSEEEDQSKSKSSKTKSKKEDTSSIISESKISKSKNDEKSSKSNKKMEGKEYGYSGYLNKDKGKYYHEKGIYFNDEREKGVKKDLLKEEERLKEEKLREKLEDSNSSKSSIEESKEENDSEKKSKTKSKSSNISKSKTTSKKTDKKSSNASQSEKSSSYKPKNINEAFWGLDLDEKEEEERRKREGYKEAPTDPLQKRKNRIKILPRDLRIKILEEEREKLKLKIKHNFHVVTNVLHAIFRDSMAENVPFYTEYYKEKFLYKNLVFQKTNKQYSNGSDQIELSKGIIIDEASTDLFMTKHYRWAQMYRLLVFQFCRDFALKCKES